MLNKRHLTEGEKQAVVAIVEDAGIVEVIRLLGAYMAQNHAILETATGYRSKLFKIASEIHHDKNDIVP